MSKQRILKAELGEGSDVLVMTDSSIPVIVQELQAILDNDDKFPNGSKIILTVDEWMDDELEELGEWDGW